MPATDRIDVMRRWACRLIAAVTFATAFMTDAAGARAEAPDPWPLAVALVQRGRFDEARMVALQSRDPLLADWVLWSQASGDAAKVRPEALAALLERRPDWPGRAILQQALERALVMLPEGERCALARRLDLRSADGLLVLAVCLWRAGERHEARRLLEQAWPSAFLDAASERDLRRLFGPALTPELDARRADALLWQGRHAELGRLMSHLRDGERQLALARLALQQRQPGVDALIRAVPARLQRDPGLLFDRIAWRLARGQIEAAARLLADAPADPAHQNAWWRLRARLLVELIQRGDFVTAHRLLQDHRAPPGAPHARAEWLAGWIALRFLDRPGEAYQRFRALYEKVDSPVSRARAAYWAGRAAERLGNPPMARHWYERAAAHPTTFYGQLALEQIGGDLEARLRELIADSPKAALPPSMARDSRVILGQRLCQAGAPREAVRWFVAALSELPRAEEAAFAGIARLCDHAHVRAALAAHFASLGHLPRVYAFPLPDDLDVGPVARETGVDPAWLLALALQESRFDPKAVSPAGAIGLTQILPHTARAVAAAGRLPWGWLRLSDDPRYQLHLAALHLRELFGRYNGDPMLALAAYNAGSGRVDRWLREIGDPRGRSREERLDWLERIPYEETRNYVQRVMEGHAVYRALLRLPNPPGGRVGGLRVEVQPPRPRPGGRS